MAVTILYWDVTLCSLAQCTGTSKEPAASVIRVDNKLHTNMWRTQKQSRPGYGSGQTNGVG
jgi:hypothetical protein